MQNIFSNLRVLNINLLKKNESNYIHSYVIHQMANIIILHIK